MKSELKPEVSELKPMLLLLKQNLELYSIENWSRKGSWNKFEIEIGIGGCCYC